MDNETFQSIYDELIQNEDFECIVDDSHYLSKNEIEEYSKNHSKYKCKVNYDNKSIEFDLLSIKPPQGEDMIECIIVDARAVFDNEHFSDFCYAFGFLEDSIKSMKMFTACKDMKNKLIDMFGETLFNRFMNCDM